jgi:nicotinamidase-related amidase
MPVGVTIFTVQRPTNPNSAASDRRHQRLRFPEGEQLCASRFRSAKNIAALKHEQRCRHSVDLRQRQLRPLASDFKKIVDHCRDESRGKRFVELLLAGRNDYFVLKPKTPASTRRRSTCCSRTWREGFDHHRHSGNTASCSPANDAYERDYKIFVPSDCTASNTEEQTSTRSTDADRAEGGRENAKEWI